MIEHIKSGTKVIGAAVCFALSFIVTMIPSAMAETFSIDGMALNTNSRFPLKDGHPIMSIWALNPNDNDQQFDRRNGNLLQHRSTGKCLNTYKPSVGSIVNVWPCNANDGDQKFSIVSAGNNKMLIKKDGTSLCLDMPNRSANTRMTLSGCNSGNANQQFVSNAGTTTNNPPPQLSNPDISIRLSFNGNFTAAQRTAIQKGAQNWESIITRDMVPGGVLNVNVTEGNMSQPGNHWAETDFSNSYANGQAPNPRQRFNLAGQYHTTMKFRRSFLDSPNSNQLTKLATHELGHALYLDEASYDRTLGVNSIMNIYPLYPTITEGIYRRLESIGYSVNRNPSLQW
jgi:Ricin-type beta-trefoil lectin domain